jgi:hypothetical protein
LLSDVSSVLVEALTACRILMLSFILRITSSTFVPLSPTSDLPTHTPLNHAANAKYIEHLASTNYFQLFQTCQDICSMGP